MPIFEVRQQVATIRQKWLVKIYETPSERLGQLEFERCRTEHPGEYFELVRVEAHEACLAYTLQRDT